MHAWRCNDEHGGMDEIQCNCLNKTKEQKYSPSSSLDVNQRYFCKARFFSPSVAHESMLDIQRNHMSQATCGTHVKVSSLNEIFLTHAPMTRMNVQMLKP